MQRVFKENNFFYPVEMSVVEQAPLTGFVWLKPSNFIQTMAAQNDLAHILGGFSTLARAANLLETFWERYRVICPHFQLFQRVDAGLCRLRDCIPLYLHGDEGITFKKNGVLIIAFQSPLGYGTSKRPQEMSLNLQNFGESGLPLNFLKSGMLTRMVSIICPKDFGV